MARRGVDRKDVKRGVGGEEGENERRQKGEWDTCCLFLPHSFIPFVLYNQLFIKKKNFQNIYFILNFDFLRQSSRETSDILKPPGCFYQMKTGSKLLVKKYYHNFMGGDKKSNNIYIEDKRVLLKQNNYRILKYLC